ncbi:MAG: flagellar hook-length control protein FliK [Acidovorax sp.]
MESARLPESHGAHAARGGHRAAHGGKAAASVGDAAQQPQDAFSALLSLLGGGDDALDATDALAFGDGGDAQAPAGLALLAQDAATGAAPGHAGHAAAAGQAGNPASAEAAAAAAAGLLGLLPGHQGAAVAPTQALGAGSLGVPAGTAEGLLAGASASKGGVGGLGGTGGMWGSWGVQGAAVQGSLVAQTAAQDGAAEAAQLQGLAQPGEKAAPAKNTKGAGLHPAATAATATDTSVMAKGLDKKQAVDLQTAATASTTGAAASAVPRDTTAAASGAAHRLADGDLAAQAALAAPGLQALAEALGEPRRAGRAESSQEGTPSVHGVAATGESAADLAQAVPDGAGVAADASQMQGGGDDQLAQQVAFWVNQKTQNAELTLDRDGQPVQVHVSLSGNEAHVTFRSDQVQTVAALQSGAAQLRDALAQQGLVLAGVQVGSAGADGKGGGHPQGDSAGRQGARQGRALVGVQGVEGAVAQAAKASGTSGASALDVFV